MALKKDTKAEVKKGIEAAGEAILAMLTRGAKVFIRTVTHYYTGEIITINMGFIILRQASWIACTARFADTLANGELQEVEPYPGEGLVAVSLGSIVDVTPWLHELPRKQK